MVISNYGMHFAGLSVYEVHIFTMTLLFKKNFAVYRVLRAGSWNSQSTFVTFSL